MSQITFPEHNIITDLITLYIRGSPSSKDRCIESVRKIEKCGHRSKRLPKLTSTSHDMSHDTTPQSLPPLSSTSFHLPPLPPLHFSKSHSHPLQQRRVDPVASRKPLPSSLKKSLARSGSTALPDRSSHHIEAVESGLLVSRLKLCHLSSSMTS